MSSNPFQIEDCRATATPLTIRFADVDMMCVVHHTAYIHYFEQIRFSVLRNLMGLDPGVLRREAISCPVLECQAKYIRPLLFGDDAIGYGKVQMFRTAMFRFDYSIVRKGTPEQSCASGWTTHCFVDEKLELQLRPPRVFSDAFAKASGLFPGCFENEKSGSPCLPKKK